jgi:hypothetical protein
MQNLENLYLTAHESNLTIHRSRPAVLQVVGPDSLDLLNRMSTNNLLHDSFVRVHKTVFTNANARIIDIVTVIPGDQDFLLLCWQDSPSILREWLSGYIFFQDDVHLIENTRDWELFDFVGPKAQAVLNNVKNLDGYPGEGLLQIEGNYVWYEPLGILPRYRFLCYGDLASELFSPGQRIPRPVQNKNLAELLRIEAGVVILVRKLSPGWRVGGNLPARSLVFDRKKKSMLVHQSKTMVRPSVGSLLLLNHHD